MPNFFYRAKSSPKDLIQGIITADTESQAINKIIQMGYSPILVEEEKLESKRLTFFKKISSRDTSIFTHQLSSLIESGLTLLNALNTILTQTQNKDLKIIIQDIIYRIKDGSSFAESLKFYSHIFSNLYVAMINSGEIGGNLSETLKNLAEFSEREENLKSELKVALAYPFFIGMVGLITIYILISFVIPRLLVMFEDMGQVLPLPTRILIFCYSFLKNYSGFILLSFLVILFIFMRRFKSPEGSLILDRFRLRLPIIGELIRNIEISRFCRTLSTLLSSGIPLVFALEITASVLNNLLIKEEVKEFQEKIRKGSSLSDSLKTSKYFPVSVTNIVAIGEEAGTLERLLAKLSNEYEQEIERRLNTLTRLLEPAIILIMGLLVGFIVLSMLLPIFQLNLIVR